MKRKKKYTGVAIIIIVIVVVLYYFNREVDVAYSKPEWNCTHINAAWQCTVNFEVENNTYNQQYRKFSIRGIIVPGATKTASLRTCGEEAVEIILGPKEKNIVSDKFVFECKPNEIKVLMLK